MPSYQSPFSRISWRLVLLVFLVVVPRFVPSHPRPTCAEAFKSVSRWTTILLHGNTFSKASVSVPKRTLDPLGLLVLLPGGLHQSSKTSMSFQLLRVDHGHLPVLWWFMQKS